MSDHYATLNGPAQTSRKIERSEFLSVAFPIESEVAFFEALHDFSRRNFDASHHCWAYRLRERARSSDAGEPSGTAGKPILIAIEASHLFDVGVIVARWFGGIKLGSGGLARAYRNSAAAALSSGVRIDRYVYSRVQVTVPFPALGTIYRLLDPPDVVLVHEEFGAENIFTIDVRLSFRERLESDLTSLRLAFRADRTGS